MVIVIGNNRNIFLYRLVIKGHEPELLLFPFPPQERTLSSQVIIIKALISQVRERRKKSIKFAQKKLLNEFKMQKFKHAFDLIMFR